MFLKALGRLLEMLAEHITENIRRFLKYSTTQTYIIGNHRKSFNSFQAPLSGKYIKFGKCLVWKLKALESGFAHGFRPFQSP